LPLFLSGQVPDAQTLVGLHTVTTAERNAITGAGEGMLIFDTDEESVYVYTTSFGWRKFQSAPNTYTGSFTISAPGAISVAGLPFEPSHINFSAHANIESNNIDSDNAIGNNATNLYNSFGNMNGFAKDENGSIVQLVIYSGASGNSVNDISRYSSDSNCIGIRYSSQNGDDLGKILTSLTSFNTDGFRTLFSPNIKFWACPLHTPPTLS